MSSTSPGTLPGTTSGTSAAGKQVVASRHARSSPSRTSASTAHCRPCAYSRVPAVQQRQVQPLVIAAATADPPARGRCARRRSPRFPSSAVTVSRTWYSRAVSGVDVGAGCPLTSASSTTRPPAPVPHRVMHDDPVLARVRDQAARVLGVAAGTSTWPPPVLRFQTVRGRPCSVTCISEGARSYRPHDASTSTVSVSSGTMNDRPIAEAAMLPDGR